MTKEIEYQQLSEYLGMSPKSYVEWGLSVKKTHSPLPITDLVPPPSAQNKKESHAASPR